jgi:drug/metabolite transporter (DMT)-like permease
MSIPAGHQEALGRLEDASTTMRAKPKAGLRLKTYALILLMVILNPVSNILLKKGMNRTGAIWLGIGCLLAFFVAYLLVLSWADYSFVQPSSALANGLTALLAYLLLHEFITPLRWAGILLICAGVFVVGHTQPQTTEQT